MKTYSDIAQRTDEWQQLRKGKITGTLLKSIVGTPKARQDALYETIAGRLTVTNSPDGLIGENEAIEVKCMGGKNHVKMWLTDKIPDEYEWQVVQYFCVNEKLEKLYFVGYNPDIPVHPLHIIEVNRKEIAGKIAYARKLQKAFSQEVEAILSTIIKI